MINLFEIFRSTARRQPQHVATIDYQRRRCDTYLQLLQDVERLGALLEQAGVRAEDCVGLHVPSGRAYMVATYAVWQCGACVVPIPLELTFREKHLICSKIAMNALVSSGNSSAFWESWQRGAATRLGALDYIPLEPSMTPPAGFQATNPAFIRFSSGTTGDAKGVVLSHETIFDRIRAANEVLNIGPEDRVAWLLSMAYHFAVSIVAYLSFGASIVLPKRSVNLARAIIEASHEQSATVIYGSPLQYELMAADRSRLMLNGVRIAISTTASLPRETAETFYRRFCFHPAQVYGIIEVGLPAINLRDPGRFDTVGQVLPALKARLVDVGFGEHLKEIQFRGWGLLDAYYDPWQTREQIMPDGWFRTGDLGELDENGCLFIRGRSKEMINVGGMKVFPREVEAVLRSHPAIREAVVYSVGRMPDRESLCARVVAHADASQCPAESELRQFCAKQLAHFKVPERIEFVGDLARTASGKILRRAVEPA